jgi:hypothetical protein
MDFQWAEIEHFALPYTGLEPSHATYSVISGLQLFLLIAKYLLEGEYIREGFSEKNLRGEGNLRLEVINVKCRQHIRGSKDSGGCFTI